MVSTYKPKEREIVDAMDSFRTAFDGFFWLYLIAFLGLFLLLLCTMSKKILEKGSWEVKENTWNILTMLLNQFNNLPKLLIMRSSIIAMIVFIDLVTVVFLNLFATTLVIIPKPEVIDTFQDLSKKKTITPTFMKQDPYWHQFSKAKFGPYKEVWDICKRVGEEDCFLSFSGVDPSTLIPKLKVATNFIDGACVFIIQVEILPGFANIMSGLSNRTKYHVSKEHMKPDFKAFIYSRNISNHKRTHMDLRSVFRDF